MEPPPGKRFTLLQATILQNDFSAGSYSYPDLTAVRMHSPYSIFFKGFFNESLALPDVKQAIRRFNPTLPEHFAISADEALQNPDLEESASFTATFSPKIFSEFLYRDVCDFRGIDEGEPSCLTTYTFTDGGNQPTKFLALVDLPEELRPFDACVRVNKFGVRSRVLGGRTRNVSSKAYSRYVVFNEVDTWSKQTCLFTHFCGNATRR